MLRRLRSAWTAFWADELEPRAIHDLSHVDVKSIDGGYCLTFVSVDKVTRTSVWFTKEQFRDYIVRQYSAVRLQENLRGQSRGDD